MTDKCPGIDHCPKIDIIMDKDILDSRAAEAIREVCRKCDIQPEPEKYRETPIKCPHNAISGLCYADIKCEDCDRLNEKKPEKLERISDEEFTDFEVQYCKDNQIRFPAEGAYRDECNRDAQLAADSKVVAGLRTEIEKQENDIADNLSASKIFYEAQLAEKDKEIEKIRQALINWEQYYEEMLKDARTENKKLDTQLSTLKAQLATIKTGDIKKKDLNKYSREDLETMYVGSQVFIDSLESELSTLKAERGQMIEEVSDWFVPKFVREGNGEITRYIPTWKQTNGSLSKLNTEAHDD